MLPRPWGAQGLSVHDKGPFHPLIDEVEMQSHMRDNGHENHEPPASMLPSEPLQGGDTITCLNGLRGIACLLVFNYHFLWPWTAHIALGHGALPPRSPEPYNGWPFLPIVCLLHRGRPMVAIFFAISGYVLCRHPLKAIHARRLDVAYKSLASAAFRRAFRLFLPPLLSMFLVAMMAQIGIFRSERDIYTGPDSKYINGSVTVGYVGRPCTNITSNSSTPMEMAQYLRISNAQYLVNVTGNTTADWSGNSFCLNTTSRLVGPATLYNSMNATEQVWWKLAMGMWISGYESRLIREHEALMQIMAEKEHNRTLADHAVKDKINKGLPPGPELPAAFPKYNDWSWVQLGGSWEEHPIIHEKMTYAIGNLTTTYMEWANPFNFGLYFPRYDPHTFTIPLEFHGSVFIYFFLLATAALKFKWRMSIGGLLTLYSLRMGRWDMALFMGALLQSELDIQKPSWGWHAESWTVNLRSNLWYLPQGRQILRWCCAIIALHLLSYPDAGAEFTPGFMQLSEWVPRYYGPLSGWMFYQAIGALMLLPCILRSPLLREFFDKPIVQYLGKISFSFYLVHGPVLHSLGFWLMPRLFDRFGLLPGLSIGYVVLLAVSLYIAEFWYKKVDIWSTSIGKRVERLLLD
ncbi:uncharacterized protein PV09_08419 [Verruconis gallopava]|uniref:Acyltransferase 3 domain-containing protein n=1 Tax=Verruconis gallopava TaxID=253628 RepID=A0A0D1YH03_9PEZI|nr:uncharacterized protein PV09_08419 [Verruconis gallopava]KIW00077.1 hypothetical protein PV09_08419 [Verruconis gallopava]